MSRFSHEVLRTPDERFANLPGFPWVPSFYEDLDGLGGLRVATLDEGPRDGHIFLCLHGQPTWSYLYRKMIPVFLAAGGRVVAPDLIGFGRSDKPVDDAVYTMDLHRDMLLALVDRLELRQVTLVCQDWGGLLGLTLPVDRPHLVSRLIVMNTALAVGQPLGEGFEAWRAYSRTQSDLAVGALIRRSGAALSDAEVAAYDAPFPDVRFKGGVRRFPELVPDGPDAPGADVSRRAARWWSQTWEGPTFMAVGARDPVLAPSMPGLQRIIRGCPEPLVLDDVGHFVQEAGDRAATAALAAFDAG